MEPVARREQPYSVPKNQYKAAMMTTVKITSSTMGLSRDRARTLREETSRVYLLALMAVLALLSMMRRLMEYRASWVNMPARMAGMPMAVWNTPVTSPASRPTAKATRSATHALHPEVISMAATAPPVAMEPSTVRSATSRMR